MADRAVKRGARETLAGYEDSETDVTMKGFRQFILRGNVVDLAVGIVIGAAFTTVVNDFVKAFLTPLVGVATGGVGDFSTRTVRVAKTDFPYGAFINGLIAFILTALALYYCVVLPTNKLINRLHGGREEPAQKRHCPECLSPVPLEARRCAFCTVELEAVPEAEAEAADAHQAGGVSH